MRTRISALFRYKADLYPVSMTLMNLAASLVFYFLAPFWAILFLPILLYHRKIAPIHQHNHAHLGTFKNPKLNFIYDAILGLLSGFTTSGWELHHNLGHHEVFLTGDDITDIRRFKAEDGRLVSRIKHSILCDLFSWSDCFKIASRIHGVQKNSLKRKFYIQNAIQVFVLAILLLVNLKVTLIVFVIPNILFRWSVFFKAYGQHYKTDHKSLFTSSQNILNEPKSMLNLGHHTAHHLAPQAHWSRLPNMTSKLMGRIPNELILFLKN